VTFSVLRAWFSPYLVQVTVLEVISRSSEYLEQKGVESPRLQAELLLAHLLNVPRMQLYLAFERVLSREETDSFREFVRRRGRREPLQHILGSTSFCGFEIAVDQHVLVPRPETELLAEMGWTFLRSLPPEQDLTALDLGTGSGCIAIAVAGNCPRVEITAIDISGEALRMARQNTARHGLEDHIHFVEGNGLAAVPADACFDLILSNPPYVPSAEIQALEPEVRDHDPRLALNGGPEGLDFHHRIAQQAGRLLKPHGKVMLEFGDGQVERLRRFFEQQKWIVEQVAEDYNQRPRILIARWTAC